MAVWIWATIAAMGVATVFGVGLMAAACIQEKKGRKQSEDDKRM